MSDAGSDNEEDQQYEIVFADDQKKDNYVRKDGKASAKFANGDTYVGEYKSGKRHGFGVYTFASLASYEGEYVDGKKQGQGTFTNPDGGKYVGQWRNDKRSGQGNYYYPNGDVFKGTWKNHYKHGDGVYYFSINASYISGQWSAGQLTYGQWYNADGSVYSGQFFKNKLQGPGLFQFNSGHRLAGRFDKKGKFIHDASDSGRDTTATASSPPQQNNAAAVGSVSAASPLTLALREVEKAVLKADHFEGIYRLKKEFEGVPNFRRIGETLIYACGQPSIEGFRACAESIVEHGAEKLLWINLRDEPVVYVNNASYTPRRRTALNNHIPLPGLSGTDLATVEKKLEDRVRFDSEKRGGVAVYFKDTFAEYPADRANMELFDEVKDLQNLRSISAVYGLLEEEDVPISYLRLPIPHERAPAPAAFDALTDALKAVDFHSTAVVFNTQMGKGRATTGTVCAYLLKRAVEASGEAADGEKGRGSAGKNGNTSGDMEEEEEEDADAGESKEAKKDSSGKELTEYDPADPNYKLGQYSIIMRLVSALPAGETLKNDVDETLERCKAMQHLRDVILYQKELYEKEISEEKKKFLMRQAQNFVERYFYLIVYYAYLKTNVEEEFHTSFSKWIAERPSILEILGSRERGPLAEFQWK